MNVLSVVAVCALSFKPLDFIMQWQKVLFFHMVNKRQKQTFIKIHDISFSRWQEFNYELKLENI